LGLRPRPRWGAYSTLPDPLAVFNGPTSKGKEGEGKRGGKRESEGRGRETEGRGWAERPYTPRRKFLATSLESVSPAVFEIFGPENSYS